MLAVIVVLAVVGAVVLWTRSGAPEPPVSSRDAFVEVPEGPGSSGTVRLDTTLYLPASTPAPAVLVAHGFGGSKQSVADQAKELARQGFVALAYSARGFGASTGQIGLDSLNYEVRDGQRLIDWLATRPEVKLDKPGDPRVGVTGASYGGALALMLAGVDKRVDAIAPVITYNDLAQALLPNAAGQQPGDAKTPAAGAFGQDGVFKRSWAGIFFAAGLGGAQANPTQEAPEAGQTGTQNTGAQQGATAPSADTPGSSGTQKPVAGQQPPGSCGRYRPEVCRAYTQLATTGRADAQTLQLLRDSSPSTVTGQITAPTMLVQGEQDTLFGLDQADRTANEITRAGGKVKMVWYTGGHDGGGPGPELRKEIGDFLSFHLTGSGADPGTGFEYAVQGAFRNSGVPSVRTITAPGYPGLTGDGTQRRTLPLTGREQAVLNPPGGNPAAVSSLPGLGSALTSGTASLAGRLAVDVPGQAASFTTAPLDAQLLVTGSATVRVHVAAPQGQPAPADGAVLFAKLYDIAPDGTRSLPGSAVAPFRVGQLPADVTVTLPGIVKPIEAGHRLQLVLATTDQAYANSAEPASYVVSLAEGAGLAVPVVPGHTSTGQSVPAGPLWGIAAVIVGALAVVLVSALRRRRSDDVDPELTGVPLVIEGLTKSYPGGLTAVNDLSFRVEHGQVLGLLGPNGAGKTTTLRMMMGLIKPSAGQIRVFGHRIAPGAPVLSRIGSFVEGSGFLPHLSGAANLRLYWAATGRPVEEAHVEEALEIAGLGDAVHRRVRTYSQGMRQRLAIAQAMLGLPDLLVLDEPTNGLDPPQIHQMREVLRRYASAGRTVLVSSHLLAEVEQTCSHVVVMHRGRLVAAGEVADIAQGGGEASFVVDRQDAAVEVLRALNGVTEVAVDGGQVHANLDGVPRSVAVAALVTAGVSVEGAAPRRRLEDAFLQLVGEDAR
ncbi:alpha/beta fold hydrolase [Solihabitans fulvus]|uniref:Alpha/beta fold hydrolase n=1 Tax=Solihabitans fulvus TaxID=1892852 RepID=A0A5B2XDB7_9PSEU|nr:alpha/beta fold hydrolase [Solihabitans fulvus]